MGKALITRPSGLVECEVNLIFNFRKIDGLEIDIEHINFGKKNSRDSSLSVSLIAGIVEVLINGKEYESQNIKFYGDEVCAYYKIIGIFDSKKYKLVICLCSDRPRRIGIITLFRI